MRYSLFLALLVFFACEKDECAPQLPSCVIDRLLDDNQLPVIRVERWDIDGRALYYFVADCCDIPNMLYDDNCEVVCSPDGGFTGQGDGNCPDFPDDFERTVIWSQPE